MMGTIQSVIRRLRGDSRVARMLHGGVSGLLGRGVGLLITAVTLPLTVRYLGKLEYGIWVTISTSVVMFGVLDLGIASTLTNFISEAYAEDDREKAQRYFSTAFWMTVLVAACLACVFAVLWSLVDIGNLLHLTDPELVRQARRSVAVAIGFFLLSLPLNLATRVLSGYQQVHIGNYFAIVNSVLSLAAIVWVVVTRGNIVHLMVAYCTAMLTGSLILNLWLVVWHKPWIWPRPSMVQRRVATQLFRQGAMFFAMQLANLVVFNSDNLVITHYLGPAEVTPYSIAWRLVSYAYLVQAIFTPSLWPAFAEAYNKRELHWLSATYWSITRKTLTLVTVVAVLMGISGRFIIRVWAGPAAVPSPLLLWTMVGWAILLSVTTNQSVLLTATRRLRVETGAAVGAAVVNLVLSLILVRHMGAEGVILSTILSFAIVMVVPQEWEVRRVLAGRFLDPQAKHHALTVEHTV